MIKQAIKTVLQKLGYRLVPANLDAHSAMQLVYDSAPDVVLDVGSSIGDTVVDWLNRMPEATVFAFEPMTSSTAKIKRKTAPWKDRVHIVEAAVSDTSGEMEFQVHVHHNSSSSLLARTETSAEILPFTEEVHTEKVPVVTLDEMFKDHPVRFSNGFLKMDVQGNELAVLKGAETTLGYLRYILTEVTLSPVYENQATFEGVLDFLTARGFKLAGFVEQFHLESGRPVYFDVLFERADG